MTLQVQFEPDARDELRAAKDWYDDERPGLGEDLLAEVDSTIKHIVRWPDLAPLLVVRGTARQVRRGTVQRFPFGLVYVMIDDVIWVIAVVHTQRRPNYWRDRIRH